MQASWPWPRCVLPLLRCFLLLPPLRLLVSTWCCPAPCDCCTRLPTLLCLQLCRQLTSLTLHDCPGISDRALVEVGRRREAADCGALQSCICRPSRLCPGPHAHPTPLHVWCRGTVQVGERCTQLRALDCTVARRVGGMLLMGEDADQVGCFFFFFCVAA